MWRLIVPHKFKFWREIGRLDPSPKGIAGPTSDVKRLPVRKKIARVPSKNVDGLRRR